MIDLESFFVDLEGILFAKFDLSLADVSIELEMLLTMCSSR